MRPLIFAAALASALLAQSASVGAETRPLEVPSRYLIIAPSTGATKHLAEGDAVLDVPLRWLSATVLSQAVDVAADDRRATLKQGQALVEMRLQFDDPRFAHAAAFCVPRVADPLRKNPLLGMGVIGALLARPLTDAQFCLVDPDRDGRAKYSVLINAGSQAARTPTPIPATPYELVPGAPVSEGDSFKITHGGGSYFEMSFSEQGHARRFDWLTFTGPSGKSKYNRILKVLKMPDGSWQIPVPGVVLIARNYDKANKTIDIEWPAVTRPVALPIPDVIRASNGFSY